MTRQAQTRSRLVFRLVLLAVVATLFGTAQATTPKTFREHFAAACGSPLEIDVDWTVFPAGGQSRHIASILVEGKYLLGCEDEMPTDTGGAPMDIDITEGVFCDSGDMDDMACSSDDDVLALAVYEEIDPAYKSALQSYYGFPSQWWNSLDDPNDVHAYFIAYNTTDNHILIVGASHKGLRFGVMDWLKSLDEVVPQDAVHGSWTPDETTDNTCSGYLDADCTGTSPGDQDPVCWDTSGAVDRWSLIDHVDWCPEKVLNYPDLDLRVAAPAYTTENGDGGALAVILTGKWKSGGTTCDSASNWWNTGILQCDWGTRPDYCNDVRLRLDPAVSGNFSHMIEEAVPTWNGTRIASKVCPNDTTPPTSADLYEQIWSWLTERDVTLVPSIYGLEADSREEPIEGENDVDGAVTEYGEHGDFAVSDGLSVIKKPFMICDDTDLWLDPLNSDGYPDGTDAVSTECAHLDEDHQVAADAPLQVIAARSVSDDGIEADDFSLGSGGFANDFDCGDLPDPVPSTWSLDTLDGAWESSTVKDTNFGYALTPEGGSGTSRLILTVPVNEETSERLYALGFWAYIPSTTALELNYRVCYPEETESTEQTRRHTVESINKTITDSESKQRYVDTVGFDAADGESGDYDHDYSWVHFTYLFRAPRYDGDNPASFAWVTFWGDQAYGDSLTDAPLLIDEIEVAEVDGQLRNMDIGTTFTDDITDDNNTARFYVEVSSELVELDPSCFEITDYLETRVGDDTARGLWGFFDAGDWPVTDYRASIQVIDGTDCPYAEGEGDVDLEAGDTVYVSYRTWSHYGLWPNVAKTHSGQPWMADVFNEDYWSNEFSPTSQIDTLASDLGHGAGGMAMLRDPFISVVGGELRGLDRAWEHRETDPDEVLASYYCQVFYEICTTLEDCTGLSGTENCEDMFIDPLASGDTFTPCDCSEWTWSSEGPPSGRMLVAGDMLTTWQNGNRTNYQVPYGGPSGATVGAREMMPPNTVFLSWWHYSTYRWGVPVGGNETILGFADDITDAGFDLIGAPAQDPELTRAWIAMATGATAPTPSANNTDTRLIGFSQYGWGPGSEAWKYHLQGAHYAWQSEWALLRSWYITDDDDDTWPGTDETSTYTTDGSLVSQRYYDVDESEWAEFSWPRVGKQLEAEDEMTWTSAKVDIEPQWLKAHWTYDSGESDWNVDYGAWNQILFRYYAQFPDDSCEVDVTCEFYVSSTALSPVITATAAQDMVTADVWNHGGRWDAWSARCDFPEEQPTNNNVTSVKVTFDVACEESSGTLVFDNPSVYQGLPTVDFPYAWSEQDIEDWTCDDDSSESACHDICGTTETVGDCQNGKTFARGW